MLDYVGIIGIVVSVLLAMLLLLLGIIGWLIVDRLRSMDGRLAALPKIEVDIASLKGTAEHHAEKQDEFCDRLEKVESHVTNTERIALMELRLTKAEEELQHNRKFGHWVRNVLAAIAGKVGAELPKET